MLSIGRSSQWRHLYFGARLGAFLFERLTNDRIFIFVFDLPAAESQRHVGLNLAGLDIARLYLALHKNPSLTIPEFLSGEETFYKVTLPNSRHFELPKLYPWMLAGSRNQQASWEVSFARYGVPLKVEPSNKHVTQPELSYIKKSSINYSSLTRDLVSGHGETAQLTRYGSQLMRLLIFPTEM